MSALVSPPVNITENTVLTLQSYIKSNIASALAAVRTDEERASGINTEVPKEYFIAPQQHAFQCPAVFTIAEGVTINNDRGPNFLCATLDVIVSVVVEEKDSQRLTKKAWRYQDALYKLLNQSNFINDDGATVRFRFTSKVESINFSEDFSFHEESEKRSEFNKEVALVLSIELQEQP